jgi:hypothetical protein
MPAKVKLHEPGYGDVFHVMLLDEAKKSSLV